MRSAWCPSHLLFFYKPLGNELVDRRFREPRRYALTAPMPLAVVDDTRCVVVEVGCELLEGARQLLQHQVGGPFCLAILFHRAVYLKHQVGQRLIGTEQVTVPQKPFYTLQFLKDGLLGHPAFIAAAESARRLRELFHPHANMKPVQDMLGMGM